MSIEDILNNRVLMTKLVWIGFLFSIVLMAIGLFVIARELFGL